MRYCEHTLDFKDRHMYNIFPKSQYFRMKLTNYQDRELLNKLFNERAADMVFVV